MYAKLEITGEIEVVTGLHIGGSDAFSAIGAVDMPIVKDVISGNPMIPGSSFKGKLRALLSKQYVTNNPKSTPNDDAECLTDIFGKSGEDFKPSRVIFSDMIMNNWDELKNGYGLASKTEIKFENTIDRLTGKANPRQIERAVRGSKFDLNIIYEYTSDENLRKDFEILSVGFKLLEHDYLGGNGTRGYGKIRINDINVCEVIGNIDEKILDECSDILKKFRQY